MVTIGDLFGKKKKTEEPQVQSNRGTQPPKLTPDVAGTLTMKELLLENNGYCRANPDNIEGLKSNPEISKKYDEKSHQIRLEQEKKDQARFNRDKEKPKTLVERNGEKIEEEYTQGFSLLSDQEKFYVLGMLSPVTLKGFSPFKVKNYKQELGYSNITRRAITQRDASVIASISRLLSLAQKNVPEGGIQVPKISEGETKLNVNSLTVEGFAFQLYLEYGNENVKYLLRLQPNNGNVEEIEYKRLDAVLNAIAENLVTYGMPHFKSKLVYVNPTEVDNGQQIRQANTILGHSNNKYKI